MLMRSFCNRNVIMLVLLAESNWSSIDHMLSLGVVEFGLFGFAKDRDEE